MKYYILIIISCLIVFSNRPLISGNYRDVTSRDLSVLIDVTVNDNPKSITLSWKANDAASKYLIYRKDPDLNDFPHTPLAETDSLNYTWTDKDVTAGKIYEYAVMAYSMGFSQDYTLTNRPRTLMNYYGIGYVSAGINVDRTDQPGRILILIDSLTAENIPADINQLESDLWSEGWTVTTRQVPRREKFDGDAVKSIKSIISEEYNRPPKDLTSVFLLGRIPVPYSGDLNPDGHDNHRGAWAADTYYAGMNESEWTDKDVNQDSFSIDYFLKPETRNLIGDGKFDQSEFVSDLSLTIGRVDMYNMPSFQTNGNFSESDLLSRYLTKDHNFRNNKISVKPQALITESPSFVAANVAEGFASNGWRNFASCLGSNSIKTGNWFGSLTTDSYLWAYGTGPGDPVSAADVGTTEQYSLNTTNAVFTMLMGSWFGDWDFADSFLRAGLAGDGMGLTCVWSGRPPAFFHQMAMGYTVGYCYLKSENNKIVESGSSTDTTSSHGYQQNYFFYTKLKNGTNLTFGARGVHQALMGDPTLKMIYSSLPKISIINLVHNSGSSSGISWNTPVENNVIGYNVYRSYDKFSYWEKINADLISGTTFTDTTQLSSKIYYMVRPVCKVVNNSGSFFAESNGTIVQTPSGIASEEIISNKLKIYPNPVENSAEIEIRISKACFAKIKITDIFGNLVQPVYSGFLAEGIHNFVLNSKNTLVSGTYFIIAETGSGVIVQKFIRIDD